VCVRAPWPGTKREGEEKEKRKRKIRKKREGEEKSPAQASIFKSLGNPANRGPGKYLMLVVTLSGTRAAL